MTEERLKSFLETLRQAEWNVVVADDSLSGNIAIETRYPSLPDAYRVFLQNVAHCSNREENAWFLCATDYDSDGNDTTTFRWNEWERMSKDAAGNDEQATNAIVRFWDDHIPILLSVHSDYGYLAITLSPDAFGTIVYGYAPEFEEVVTISDSFDDFVETFQGMVAGKIPTEYHDEAGNLCIRRAFSDFL